MVVKLPPAVVVSTGSSAVEAKAYVRFWAAAEAELEAERLRDLRQLTETESARRFMALLQMPGPYPLRSSSGLVEQQRIFSRLRHSSK